MVRPEDLLDMKNLIKNAIEKAYDVEIIEIKVAELDATSRDNIITLKGVWDSKTGQGGKFEARIRDGEVLFLKIEV